MSESTGRIHDTEDSAPHLDKRKLEAKNHNDPIHLRPLCALRITLRPSLLPENPPDRER